MTPDACLSEDELVAFAEGALEGNAAARANQHVAECPSCRAVLAALASSPSRLQSPAGAAGVVDASPLRRGMSLGRYLVLDCIGAGGMGVVYTAYDPELDRRVALKLLRESASSSAARLQQEARAMARLNHRNVASVYDVGTFNGRVFVAMEFLAGETVRQWEESPRGVPQILDVFIQAGQGLAAAHAAGIVHRDFKPDNVMVGADGRVSVLDFGLARAPNEQSEVSKEVFATPAAPASLTQTGAVLGTPNYMAPEQRDNRAVDARSDQYSFCVALHEALYGALPGAAAQRTPAVPATLKRALERGRSVDPAQRYPSLDALLDDLRAVRSPPASRRAPIAAGAALLLATVAGLLWVQRSGASMCEGGAALAESAWNQKLAEQVRTAFAGLANGPARADETVRELEGWSQRWVKAHREVCEATRVRGEQSEELLDRRMVCLQGQLTQLAATAALLSSAGPALDKASTVVRALPELSACAATTALLEATPVPSDPVTRAKYDQADKVLAEGHALRLSSRNAEAKPLAAEATRLATAVGHAPLLARALLEESAVERNLAELETSASHAWAALAQARRGHDAELEARAWLGLFDVIGIAQGNRELGPVLNEQAASAIAVVPDGEKLETQRLINAAVFYDKYHLNDQAMPLFREALARREKEYGPDGVQVAEVLSRFGDTLFAEQKLEEAEQVLRRAIAIWEKDETAKLSLDRPLASLGYTLSKFKKFDDARVLFKRALEVTEANKSGPLREARVLNLWGAMESDAKQYDAAEALHKRAVERIYTLPAESRHYASDPLSNLSLIATNRNRFVEAEKYAREAMEVASQQPHPVLMQSMSAWMTVAEAQIGQRDFVRARKEIDAIDAAMAKETGSAPSLAPYWFAIAQLMQMAQNYRMDDARAWAKKARDASGEQQRPEMDAWLKKYAKR